MARTVTWLHLSDLHAWEKRNWDAKKVLDTLQRDLLQMEEQYRLHPDLVFFTGDAAQGHMGDGPGQRLADQYEQVNDFFAGVLKTFTPAVAPENLFFVPGNHDVNRVSIQRSQYEWLDNQKDVRSILQMLQDDGADWKGFMRRLGDYHDFLVTKGYRHLLEYPQYLMYSVIRTVNGVDLRIVGLNSAWSCGRDKEKGKLWAGGEYQLNLLAAKHQHRPISIVLSHHPTNWLAEYEEGPLSKQIARDFRFYLHGHEHDGWVNILADGHTRIAAAACYERSDRPNGYNFVRLDLDAGSGEVWLRQYDSIGDGWIPRIVYRKTDNHGCWPLNNLQWLARLELNPSAKTTPSKARPEPSRQN